MIDAVIVNIGYQACSLGKVVIAEQDRNIISPKGVDRWIAAPRQCVIYYVIMNKRRQVYHLKGDAQGQQLIKAIRFHLACE